MDRLFTRAKELAMNAIAISDHGNLFGVPDFFSYAKKFKIKPIIGCEIYTTFDRDYRLKAKFPLYHMGLLAMNPIGYKNLSKLVSLSHTQGFYYKPRLNWQTIAQYGEGLICLTGCYQGYLSAMALQNDYEAAQKGLDWLIEIFGKDRLFIEVQDHGMPESKEVILPTLFKLAAENGVKTVATNDAHYVLQEDWEAHDQLLCVQTISKVTDVNRFRMTTHQLYIKSREEMELMFKDHSECLDHTQLIADMCDFTLTYGENHYPVFRLPHQQSQDHCDNFTYLKNLCFRGLKLRYAIDYVETQDRIAGSREAMLCHRLDYELSTLAKTGFVDYFLIVWDFIDWAKSHNIPVGPGRGSGAGSIIAYLVQITDVDPIQFGLLFERFLNPERVSPPDFDIDFCMRRRGEVIDYVRQKYGNDHVANIITFGTFGAKMVIRDLCRVNDVPYGEANRIAKMVPDELNISIDHAIEKSKELQREIHLNPKIGKILDDGKILEGTVRNTGTHAAGIIITEDIVENMLPVTLQDGILTTQYAKEAVEDLGLLKMDFLGLTTLTIIADSESFIQKYDPKFSMHSIPYDDENTYKLLNSGETIGVFQLGESAGMRALCKRFEISSVEEISDISALYRPGPMEWINDYVAGKKDPQKIKYPHPLLEGVCKKTYGILVYQEQVMEAVRIIAGYTLAGADILRRAMGKKKVEVMNAQRSVFIEGAEKYNAIPREKAEEIFSILEKFAGYGFNKSHSMAYAIITYQTAYLKANYPVAFMAATLSSVLGNGDKVAYFIAECNRMRIDILGPDINQSLNNFTPNHQKHSIRFGLGAIKGVGDSAAENIIKERKRNGLFKDFLDFMARVDLRIVNKRVAECLIFSGAFDEFAIDRLHLAQSLEHIISEASSLQKDRNVGQFQLFDMLDSAGTHPLSSVIRQDGPSLTKIEKLNHEKALLGFYISGHPLDDYRSILNQVNLVKSVEAIADDFRLCGVVALIEKRISKRDNRLWATFQLEMFSESLTLNCFPSVFEKYGHLLIEGNVIVAAGILKKSDENERFVLQEITHLHAALAKMAKKIHWIIDPRNPALLESIWDYIYSNAGKVQNVLVFNFEDGKQLRRHVSEQLNCNFDYEKIKALAIPFLIEA
jgi:DNA polymerase-3 subunit alpha